VTESVESSELRALLEQTDERSDTPCERRVTAGGRRAPGTGERARGGRLNEEPEDLLDLRRGRFSDGGGRGRDILFRGGELEEALVIGTFGKVRVRGEKSLAEGGEGSGAGEAAFCVAGGRDDEVEDKEPTSGLRLSS
jgi:hypothetical protein